MHEPLPQVLALADEAYIPFDYDALASQVRSFLLEHCLPQRFVHILLDNFQCQLSLLTACMLSSSHNCSRAHPLPIAIYTCTQTIGGVSVMYMQNSAGLGGVSVMYTQNSTESRFNPPPSESLPPSLPHLAVLGQQSEQKSCVRGHNGIFHMLTSLTEG